MVKLALDLGDGFVDRAAQERRFTRRQPVQVEETVTHRHCRLFIGSGQLFGSKLAHNRMEFIASRPIAFLTNRRLL